MSTGQLARQLRRALFGQHGSAFALGFGLGALVASAMWLILVLTFR